MIFKKADTSTSDKKVTKLTREFNSHYRSCIGSFIYLLSTGVDFSFAVHKLSNFSANHGKVHVEVLVHILRYIRDNRNLGFKYYENINDAPLSKLLIQVSIKTENHLIAFSDSSWKYFPDTGRSKGA